VVSDFFYRKSVKSVTHPKDWKMAKLADVGTDEAFVRENLELITILNGTLIEGKQREEVKGAIGTIQIDGLIPTFLELRGIRESRGKDLPLVDKFQLYEDFSRKLWKAYKDLTQRAAKAMGFDVGFIWQEEPKFEEGLKRFRVEWPALPTEFEKFLRDTRSEWQNELSKFRNGFLEHQEGNRKDFAKFYDAQFVEKLFSDGWGMIVDLLVILMSLRLPPRVHIVLHDDKIHGPGWPNRYRWEIEGF
jgi:hypothetical protein